MVKPQLGHDQVVSEWRWSLNTGGHKSRFHCTLRRVITKGTLEPCHLHLVLSTCLIALVVVAVNITKSKNIIVGHVDKTR